MRIQSEIKRKLKLPYTEKELLGGMTPYTAHADELAVINSSEMCK